MNCFMYNIETLEDKAQEILDMSPLEEQNIEILDFIIEQLMQKLDLCTGIPIVAFLRSIHKVGKSFFDYKMCVRLLNFYVGCQNIEQEQKDKFYQCNVYGKEKEVAYKMIQILDCLDTDEKAELMGKVYVYCAENEYEISSYFRICNIIRRCYFEDLKYLSHWKSRETICGQNKLIQQEIMESLYSEGLLSECGFDGGGFLPDDDAGTIYSLSKFGKILLEVMDSSSE